MSMSPWTADRPDPNTWDLVTGGAGFIGSHLVDRLLRAGRRVCVVDDMSSAVRDPRSVDRTRHPALHFVVGDCGDREVLGPVLDRASRVFHLAGVVGVRRLAEDPVGNMERNIDGTRAVFAGAAERGIPTLFASSSEVYGRRPVPFDEDDAVDLGRTSEARGAYACAKASGEWSALGRHRSAGWPVVVARLFNTVGPRQGAGGGMVLPRFVRQALAGQALTVYGSGTQTRCFGHVCDVVQALDQLLDAPRARGLVVNVGSDREVSVLELAESVVAVGLRRTGRRAGIRHVPFESVFPEGFVDPPRRVPSTARLRALLGWVPERRLEGIVDDVFGYESERMGPAAPLASRAAATRSR